MHSKVTEKSRERIYYYIGGRRKSILEGEVHKVIDGLRRKGKPGDQEIGAITEAMAKIAKGKDKFNYKLLSIVYANVWPLSSGNNLDRVKILIKELIEIDRSEAEKRCLTGEPPFESNIDKKAFYAALNELLVVTSNNGYDRSSEYELLNNAAYFYVKAGEINLAEEVIKYLTKNYSLEMKGNIFSNEYQQHSPLYVALCAELLYYNVPEVSVIDKSELLGAAGFFYSMHENFSWRAHYLARQLLIENPYKGWEDFVQYIPITFQNA